jgi:16S rRNA (cytidine1402-2'-O)-methyltransferase
VLGGDRRAVVCRELTKTHEEVLRGTLSELLPWAQAGVRGEVTIVVAGAAADAAAADPADLVTDVDALVATGLSRRDAVDRVAATRGLPRRVVYAAVTGRR